MQNDYTFLNPPKGKTSHYKNIVTGLSRCGRFTENFTDTDDPNACKACIKFRKADLQKVLRENNASKG